MTEVFTPEIVFGNASYGTLIPDSPASMSKTIRSTPVGLNNFSASSTLKAALEANATDHNLLIMTDSTGDAAGEWPYLLAARLGAAYPAYTVTLYPWDTTDYGAAVPITVGSGGNTLRIDLCGLSGSTLDNFMGALAPAAFGARAYTSIIISHGHNYTGLADYVLRGKFVGALEQIMLAQPNRPMAIVLQNPRQTDSLMNQIVACLTQYSADRNDIELINVFGAWIAAGKPASWYADTIHPNAAGQAVFDSVIWEHYAAARSVTSLINAAWTATVGTNLLTNPDFSDWPGAVPVGWTLGGNGVLTKEAVIVAPGYAHSARMVNGAAATSLSQIISTTGYVGLPMTLWTLQYIVSAVNLNGGRVREFDNGAGSPLVAINPGAVGLGGFRLTCISGYVTPPLATTFGPFLYSHSSNGSAADVIYQKCWFGSGTIPRG